MSSSSGGPWSDGIITSSGSFGSFSYPPFAATRTSTYETTVPCAHVTDENVEYLDGQVFACCKHCELRVEISRVPGGIHLPRLKYLLQRIVDETSPEARATQFADLSDVVGDIERERIALEEAQVLVDLVQLLIREQG